jgi:hypothetical protein
MFFSFRQPPLSGQPAIQSIRDGIAARARGDRIVARRMYCRISRPCCGICVTLPLRNRLWLAYMLFLG